MSNSDPHNSSKVILVAADTCTAKPVTSVCTAAYVSLKHTDTWSLPKEMLRTGLVIAQAAPNHATTNCYKPNWWQGVYLLGQCNSSTHLHTEIAPDSSQYQHGVSLTEILKISAQIPQDQRFM